MYSTYIALLMAQRVNYYVLYKATFTPQFDKGDYISTLCFNRRH